MAICKHCRNNKTRLFSENAECEVLKYHDFYNSIFNSNDLDRQLNNMPINTNLFHYHADQNTKYFPGIYHIFQVMMKIKQVFVFTAA